MGLPVIVAPEESRATRFANQTPPNIEIKFQNDLILDIPNFDNHKEVYNKNEI